MCLLLGATGVGKSLLVKRLQKLSSQDGKGDLGDPPPTRPTVGTNLTDIMAHKKITIRELGGCMGPIWSSYYGNCRSLLFMIDASDPTRLSASCAHLLGLLSAPPLAEASVLILFNKIGDEVVTQAPRRHRLRQAEHRHSRNQCPQRHRLDGRAALAPGRSQDRRVTAVWRTWLDGSVATGRGWQGLASGSLFL
uniref:ADP ribosylation factor like GTPase 16 n=1 Tax=Rousettus aegyptiacus TaxID=9407 RepID=A0A7J8G4X8_ROUAE|nr:ADP ribosylation factor like GTPase 16 [Rousettus aegyptiacus]